MVIFVGTFNAGHLQVAVDHDKLVILKEGTARKFVQDVEQVTFSGPLAACRMQRVLYVTERCVFALSPDGLELKEVAPGIDVERDGCYTTRRSSIKKS
jgi:propionate CoA-transferase